MVVTDDRMGFLKTWDPVIRFLSARVIADNEAKTIDMEAAGHIK